MPRAPKKLATKLAKPRGPRPALVPRPDGRGALFSGGVPGHRGAGGRPPSVVRAAALEGAAKAVPKLISILEDKQAEDRDVIAAADRLLKYGLGPAGGPANVMSIDRVREQLRATIGIITRALPAEQAEDILAQMEPIWS